MDDIWDYSSATVGLSLATFVVFIIMALWWVPYRDAATTYEKSEYSPYKNATLVRLNGGTAPLDTDAVYINDCRTNGDDAYARGINMHYNSVIDINGKWSNNSHNLSDIVLSCNDEYVPQTVSEGEVTATYPNILTPITQMLYLDSQTDPSQVLIGESPNPTTVLDIDTPNYGLGNRFAQGYNALDHIAVLADNNTHLISSVASAATDLKYSPVMINGAPSWNDYGVVFNTILPNNNQPYTYANPNYNSTTQYGSNTRGDAQCPPGTRITGLRTHVRDLQGQGLQQLQNRAITDIELICAPF
jgi:hypothetical protein